MINNQKEFNQITDFVKELFDIGLQSIDIEKSKHVEHKGKLVPIKITLKDEELPPFHVYNKGKRTINPRVREIGEELNQIGGIDLMRQSYYAVTPFFGIYGNNLEYAWNKIGMWSV